MCMVEDDELQSLEKDDLVKEVIRLRNGIREHRDSTGNGLCWHHPKLWNLLPEKIKPEIAIPSWPEFMKGCVHYRKSLDQ